MANSDKLVLDRSMMGKHEEEGRKKSGTDRVRHHEADRWTV